MIRRFAGSFAILAASLWTAPVLASDVSTILVLPYGNLKGSGTRQGGERIAEMLRTELKANDMVSLVAAPEDAPPKTSRKAPPPPKQTSGVPRNERALADARNNLAEAKDLSKKLKFKQSTDVYASVIQTFEANAAFIDFAQLIDAYLGMAVDQFRSGKEREGERALAIVVRLDPGLSLDESYPPVFQRIFEAIKKRLLAQPRGAVKIESSAEGAVAYLDGRELGPTPVSAKDVVPGSHFIKVVTGNTPGYAAKVDIASGASVQVSAQIRGSSGSGDGEVEAAPVASGPMGAIAGALANNTIDEPLLKKVSDLANKAGAEYVVLGGLLKKEGSLVAGSHLFDVKRQKLCQLMRVFFDFEMLGAQLEVYKLANDVTGKTSGCDAEPLPAKILREIMGGSEASAPVATEVSVTTTRKSSGGRRPIVTQSETPAAEPEEKPAARPAAKPAGRTVARVEPKKNDLEEDVPRKKVAEEAEPEDQPKSGVRRLEARTSTDEIQPRELTPADEQARQSGGVGRALIITAIIVVAVGAIAGGTVLFVSQASQPASGTATIKW